MYEDHPALVLRLTRLQNPNDPISYASAWLALVPQGLCVVYVTLIWATREVEVLLMFVGQMGCEALNFILKRWIREERPKRELFLEALEVMSSNSDQRCMAKALACHLHMLSSWPSLPSH